MRDVEVLVLKRLSVNRIATGAVLAREVAALRHKALDYAVERRASNAKALLARAEDAEVLGSERHHVGEESDLQTTDGRVVDGDVKKNL